MSSPDLPPEAHAVDFATPPWTIAAGETLRFGYRPELVFRPDWLRLWVSPAAAAGGVVARSLWWNTTRIVELLDFAERSAITERKPDASALAVGIRPGAACVSLCLARIEKRALAPGELLECLVRNIGREDVSVSVGFAGWGIE